LEVPVLRPQSEYLHVKELIATGLNDCAISRATGIPRATVREWRVGGPRNADCPICTPAELDSWWYAYLLGLYLGDGCISTTIKGVHRLRISLDQRYPAIIEECMVAMSMVRTESAMRVGTVQCAGYVDVYGFWKHWPCLFPQHGPGKKHLRTIELTPWQQTIARARPTRLIRGLIHSDGCRFLNRVKNTDYPRYMFTNYSDDIRGIFCRACDDYGVAWRQSNWRTISIARRPDVAKLDLVVGPKPVPTPVHPPANPVGSIDSPDRRPG
jgi:hypothetical protein